MSLSDPVLHLRAMGVVLVALAVLHAAFPRCFRWSTGLTSLSPINQALMRVHTFFVALAVGLMGMLSWPEAPALVSTPLGRRVCAGLALFWGHAGARSTSSTHPASGGDGGSRRPCTSSSPRCGRG